MPPKGWKKGDPPKKIKKESLDFASILADGPPMHDDSASDYEMPTAPKGGKKALSYTAKAIKAREKSLVEKFAVVQSKLEKPLEKDPGVVVDCFRQFPDKIAPLDKDYNYTHVMKLTSGTPFNLVKQVILNEGPYVGHVAVLLKQSMPFRFLELPKEVRTRVYKYLFKSEGGEIPMTVTQGAHKFVRSKNYGAKNKLAMLAVSKEVHDEAAPIAYKQNYNFAGTQVLNIFLLQIGQNIKYLTSLQCDTYNPTTARTVFHLLRQATSLRHLTFKHISSDQQPLTAIKNFYADANPWLHAVGSNERPDKGLTILHWDRAAYHRREEDDEGETQVIQWADGEWRQFLEGISGKCRRGRGQAH